MPTRAANVLTIAWVLAGTLAASIAPAAGADEDAGKVAAAIEPVGEPIVIADEAKYCAFVDLVRVAPTGDLIVVYNAGAHHLAPDLAIRKRVSADDGRTWGTPETVVPALNAGYGVRDPHICQLPDGTLLLNYFSHPTTSGESCRVHVIRSMDAGRTWSKPEATVALHAAGLLVDGDSLLMSYRSRGYGSAALGLSLDGGRTWPVTKELFGGGADCAYGAILRTKPGSPAPYFTACYAPRQGSIKVVGTYFKVAR